MDCAHGRLEPEGAIEMPAGLRRLLTGILFASKQRSSHFVPARAAQRRVDTEFASHLRRHGGRLWAVANQPRGGPRQPHERSGMHRVRH